MPPRPAPYSPGPVYELLVTGKRVFGGTTERLGGGMEAALWLHGGIGERCWGSMGSAWEGRGAAGAAERHGRGD